MKTFRITSKAYKTRYWWIFKSSYVHAVISTVKLPGDMGYETCIFCNNGSDVVEAYTTMHEAISGHARWALNYGAVKATFNLTM